MAGVFDALVSEIATVTQTTRLGRVIEVSRGTVTVRGLEDVATLGDRVELIESLPFAELVARTRAAEFAALPSLYEGFGLPALEAMTVGTPVLAAHAGALPEVCGDAAVYCDPLSVDDIARGLLLLATVPVLRARLSAAGTARSAAFSWDRCASTTVAALEAELGRLSGNAPQ